MLCYDTNNILFEDTIVNLENTNLPTIFNLFDKLYQGDPSIFYEFKKDFSLCCYFFKNNISDFVENKKVLDTLKGATKLSLLFAYLLGHKDRFDDENFINDFKYGIFIHILGIASDKIHEEPLNNRECDDFTLGGGGVVKDAKNKRV